MYTFFLQPILPFRLDYTIWALRRRSKNIVDLWHNKRYTRLFFVQNQTIKVTVEQQQQEILVSVNRKLDQALQIELTHLLEKMLGLNSDLSEFYNIAKKDPTLHAIALKFLGVKPPRYPDIFEAIVNAIACQQISLDAGIQIQNRLVLHRGKSFKDNNGTFYAFPIAQDVANCSITELKKLGFSTNKSRALINIALQISRNKNLFADFKTLSNGEILKFLCQFQGIGRWSAEYVLLRGLGKIEIFPGDDVGAKNNLQQILGLTSKLDYEHIAKISKKWYPYAGFIYFHLLLQKLDYKGVLT